jgi:multisubunit Na+/H+ antiporter MnhG subunit
MRRPSLYRRLAADSIRIFVYSSLLVIAIALVAAAVQP